MANETQQRATGAMKPGKTCGTDVHHGPFDPWNVARDQPTDFVVCRACGVVLKLVDSGLMSWEA